MSTSSSATLSNSVLSGYLTGPTGRFFDGARRGTEYIDRGLMFGEHFARVGSQISHLAGNPAASERFESVSSAFGAARSPLSLLRTILPWEKAVTLKMFRQQNPDGSFLKAQLNPQGEYTRNANGGIDHDHDGHYVLRDWMDIVMDILALVARTLSAILFFVKHAIADLGKHAKWMGAAVVGLWGAVLSINLVQSLRNLVDEANKLELRKKVMGVVTGVLDLAALPFDAGIGMNSPGGAIAGGVICVLSASVYLVNEVICT